MRNLLLILLFCIVVSKPISKHEFRDKMVLLAKAMRQLKTHKENLRKMQDVEETSVVSSETEPKTTSTPSPVDTYVPSTSPAYNGSNANTTSPPFDVDVDSPVGDEEKQIDKKDSSLRIKKFHNFLRPRPRIIQFSVFLYYFHRKIVVVIYIRVKIVYRFRLRNLEEKAQSVPAKCVIKDPYKDLAGTLSEGDNVDYLCESPAELGSDKVVNVTLDTSYPMDLDGESLSFEEISFDEDAAEESVNLVKAPPFKKVGVLSNAYVYVPFERKSFKINGTLSPGDLLTLNEPILMEFYDIKEEIMKNISCTPVVLNSSNNYAELECDTSKTSLRTYVSNISLSKSREEDIFMVINLAEQPDIEASSINVNNIVYRQNSGGLTGAAIAGIVIACVVVLIAASIATILLKKPHKKEEENTTVMELKAVENI